MAVEPVPEGFHSVTPSIYVQGAAQFIDFLKQAFEAEEVMRFARPDGTIGHAEVRIGDSAIMVAEPAGEVGPMPSAIYLYLNDADAAYRRALQAGATSIMEPADQFYGDRNAGVRDPFGNVWWIATHIEDVSPEEIRRRAEAFMGPQSAS